MKKIKDYRLDQKVIATIELEDKGQDFIELDLLENGVILGDSVMFSKGRISFLGIGTNDGTIYYDFQELKNENKIMRKSLKVKGLWVYMFDTGEKKPLPWKADTLNYKIIGIKKAVKINRFIKK